MCVCVCVFMCVHLCGETFGEIDVDASLNALHFPRRCFTTVEWAYFCVHV